MRLSDEAAQIAQVNGGFLMAGDYTKAITGNQKIEITEKLSLRAMCCQCIRLIDAPVAMINAIIRETPDHTFTPHYSDFEFELPHQAAMAQMLHDAGEGFDLDDLLSVEALDAEITVVNIYQGLFTE